MTNSHSVPNGTRNALVCFLLATHSLPLAGHYSIDKWHTWQQATHVSRLLATLSLLLTGHRIAVPPGTKHR